MAFTVSQIISARDDTWGVEFSDGLTLFCAKKRNETKIDQMVVAATAADPDHGAHVQAMIAAVRAYEAANPA